MRDDSNIQRQIVDSIFSLRTVKELKNFITSLDTDSPFSAATANLASSWLTRAHEDGSEKINPHEYLSDDLSAAILGRFPIIFMGTNAWATKPYFGPEYHKSKIDQLLSHLQKVSRNFSGKTIVLALIPEKDYVIDRHFLKSGRFAGIDSATARLEAKCLEMGIKLIHNSYIDPLRRYEARSDFEYLDSHLPARHYFQIFAQIMVALGIDWKKIAPHYTMSERQIYGDLQSKFSGHVPQATWARVPKREHDALSIIGGTATFADPLGETRQMISNAEPICHGKVLILGDSHSSILSSNNLTYLMSSAFELCEFHWNPFAIREDPAPTDADMVVMEISQRFIL
jgi:hypothetical protein